MTPAALTAALDTLGWSQSRLAHDLGCTPTLVRRWALGEATVPAIVAAWLARRATDAAAHPAPVGWQRRTGRAA